MIETTFTPFASLGGGALIGLASVLLMLTIGRVMGATGVLAGIFAPSSWQDASWRIALLGGMLTGPAVYLLVAGQMPEITVPVSTPMLLIGGFIVGIGVTYGSGCTSGHGVCGISRLSLRGMAATGVYIVAGGLGVVLFRHILGVI